jgi:two-component system sensor histidine kinase VicK
MCCILFLTLIGLFATGSACAQEDEEETSRAGMVFMVTILIGIGMAVFLAEFAKRSSQVREREREEMKRADRNPMASAVLQKMRGLSGPAQAQKKTARAVAHLLEEKVEERVMSVKQELSKEYGQIIEEKNKEQTKLLNKFKSTIAEKKQTESIVRSIAEGLVVVNNTGEVLLMNPTAEKLLGVKKEQRLGKPLMEDVKDDQLFSIAKEAEGGTEKEIELSSKDDATKKVLRSSSAVIEDESGKTVGMVTVLSDITKQKELDQMKSEFIANVSHELRHPIGAIKQSLSIILNKTAGPITQHQEKFLANAKRNLERLALLIDNLLDLAKYEARKMQLSCEVGRIDSVINDVCDSLTMWAKSKEITIKKNVEEGLPEISFDPQRITQVLNNLVANAIKFTPAKGTVTIEVAKRKDDCIAVSVMDTGVGIAKENLGNIFDKFVQASERAPTDVSGTGLGLSIAKEIVELHGGKIWAESNAGEGARFIFALPLTPIAKES